MSRKLKFILVDSMEQVLPVALLEKEADVEASEEKASPVSVPDTAPERALDA